MVGNLSNLPGIILPEATFLFGELKAILERAGFTRIDATATHHYYSVVTGYKP